MAQPRVYKDAVRETRDNGAVNMKLSVTVHPAGYWTVNGVRRDWATGAMVLIAEALTWLEKDALKGQALAERHAREAG
jgi:hypothetical protein